jgi:hypothetical protein
MCQECVYGTYLLSPPDRPLSCKTCDINAHCFGRNNIAPRKNYWRSSNTSDLILPCLNEEACGEGNIDNQQGVCN